MTASAILCKLSTESQRISKKTGFPGGLDSKVSACNVRDLDSIPGSGRSPGEGNSNPLQYSCLENPMDTGTWQVTVHGVAKNQTRLSDFTRSWARIPMLFSQYRICSHNVTKCVLPFFNLQFTLLLSIFWLLYLFKLSNNSKKTEIQSYLLETQNQQN